MPDELDDNYEPAQDPYCWYDESDENFTEQLTHHSKTKNQIKMESTEKKIFKVEATMTSFCYIYVKAKDESEAREIAETIDGGNFISDDHTIGGWDITDANEVPEAEAVNPFERPDEDEDAE